nr:MFS transporter [Micromonospora sp. DSM 115978]
LTAGAIPIGLAADRYRRTAVAGAAAALAAVSALLTGLVVNTFQLVLARIGAGFGQASVLPVHNSLIVDAYPVNGRSTALAVHNLAGPVGLLVAPVAVGAIASAAGGDDGWRWAFAACGGLLALGALAALLLREPARGAGEREAVLGAEIATQLV